MRGLLEDHDAAVRMGRAAQSRVRDEFLAVRSLMQYLGLFEKILK